MIYYTVADPLVVEQTHFTWVDGPSRMLAQTRQEKMFTSTKKNYCCRQFQGPTTSYYSSKEFPCSTEQFLYASSNAFK